MGPGQLYLTAQVMVDAFCKLAAKENRTQEDEFNMQAYLLAFGFCLIESQKNEMPYYSFDMENCCCCSKEGRYE